MNQPVVFNAQIKSSGYTKEKPRLFLLIDYFIIIHHYYYPYYQKYVLIIFNSRVFLNDFIRTMFQPQIKKPKPKVDFSNKVGPWGMKNEPK